MSYINVQNKVWSLSVSKGASPYTLIPFELDGNLFMSFGLDHLKSFTNAIGFFIWEDYSEEEFKDFLRRSEEYFTLPTASREDFILMELSKKLMNGQLLTWQKDQMYIALGIALSELKKSEVPFKLIENIEKFKKILTVENATLLEVVLY